MCSDLKKSSILPPNSRKWKILLRSAAVFFALFAAVEIFLGLFLRVYCFIPLDLLNIFGSIRLWRFSNAWRIYFIFMSAMSAMLEWFLADMLAMIPEESGVLPVIVFAAMALHIIVFFVLLNYPGSRYSDAGK